MSADARQVSDDAIAKLVLSWLKAKNLDAPPPNGSITSNGKTVSHYALSERGYAASRWTLDEVWPEPHWYSGEASDNRHGVTTITTIRSDHIIWFWIEVDSPLLRYRPTGSDEEIVEPQTSGTPGIVLKFMQAFELDDGNSPSMPGSLYVRTESHLRALVTSLKDDSRFSAIYVSVPPSNVSVRAWTKRIEEVTQGSPGMAISVVLDPILLTASGLQMGFKHSVPAGGMRTFLPGVKFFDDADAYRHKLLSPAKFQETRPDRLSRLLRRAQVQRLASAPLPRLLLEVDSEMLRGARFTTIRTSATSPRVTESEQNLTRSLDEHDSEWLDLTALAELYANENDGLRQELNTYKGFAEIANFLDAELSSSRLESAKLLARIGKLQSQLSAQGFGDEAYMDQPLDEAEKYPEDFEELVDRVAEFRYLTFAGDRDSAIKLDEHPGIRSGLIKAWETLKTLNSYAELKIQGRYSQNLMEYTKNGSHGGYLRIPEVKASESASVMSNVRLSRMREIDVPPEVDPSRIVKTKSHVALQNGISNYPRLYFFDATGRNGMVYIGYLGEHLENTRTN